MSTVDEIQSRVAAYIDQDEDSSSISSDDYSLRLEFINKRERQWSEVSRWDVLYKEFFTNTSTSSGNLTVALPADFRVEAGFPVAYIDGQEYELPVIAPTQERQYTSSQRYVKKLGNSQGGYNLIFHPGTSGGQLASGATVFVSYYSFPTSLSSPADVVMCPNPEYIVHGVIGDVWEANEDARFQLKQDEADRILQNMLEFEATPSEASTRDRVRPIEQTRYNYRWGK